MKLYCVCLLQQRKLVERRMSLETVEMDACVSVNSGQQSGRQSVDIGAVVNLDVDVDSLDSFPVCTTEAARSTTEILDLLFRASVFSRFRHNSSY